MGGVATAWAGGDRGRRVIDKVLALVSNNNTAITDVLLGTGST